MTPFLYALKLLLAGALAATGMGQPQPASDAASRIFAASSEIGKTLPGSTEYDAASGSYRVTGGGSDMWGTSDDFHLAWVKLSGDATLTADLRFPPDAPAPLEKGVLIFRQSLDSSSAYADIALHADGHATLQYRLKPGGITADVVAPQHAPTRLRIERRGNLFTTYTAIGDGPFTAFSSQTVAMTGPVYVGLGVCSHNASGLATVTFSHVSLTQP
jgi:hypothetical protein